ncbi:DUF2491 family protein [Pseudomonas sp. BCRC 81390]|uniref:DUF2491 family protein n=1 Tax=Pseudomonas sp. BCRC 81390 TaxID=3054778 RepID=UPI002595E2E9|nr:DUF2491 family protein [Pseudomonas sp. BCRC 81390]MDM3884142.1 DUF2491 family protein [Pseudomonas sp. BCRC 81390]
MSFFKRLLGLESPTLSTNTAPLPKGPLGLGQGAMVSIDPGLSLLFEGATKVMLPTAQNAFAEGVIDLGQSSWLTRIYLDDEDFWIQVLTSGERNGQVDALVLFNYTDCRFIHSQGELAAIAGPASKIGMPVYMHDGHAYYREWGSSEGQTELVDLVERVTNPNESYEVQHRSMLYSRDIGLTDRKELLLFSVEESEQGAVCVTTSLGVNLFSSDLQST